MLLVRREVRICQRPDPYPVVKAVRFRGIDPRAGIDAPDTNLIPQATIVISEEHVEALPRQAMLD
jgi:hypothetical protein